ncbi:hypothetical protein [Tahibacter sp.]|uniref:ankyrin repeat domain-containing protein n=1 Tax=Tahibacter sp. TaxID=2056211 RepID=UPI0028C48B86|nr:hypothetical protein [Tahibacter sp.]
MVEADRFSHIEAMERDNAPSGGRRQAFHDVLACWRPKPQVWTQPAVAVALATEAVSSAPAFNGATKEWFASASAADRMALLYEQRNDSADRPGAGRELVEAWLLHHAATREALKGDEALDWPVPQLAREAWAAQRTLLQEAVAGECPPSYVPLLLAAGQDVSARDAQGATALHWAAAIAEDPEEDGAPYSFLAQALLDAGAQVDAREKRGLTPFAIALSKENWSAVRTLVNAGALMSEEQRSLVFEVANGMGWHELEEWQSRCAAQSLDRVLARPVGKKPEARVRL